MRPERRRTGAQSSPSGFRVGPQARTPSGFVVSEVDYPPDRWQRTHSHDGASVTLVLRGSVRERSGRREDIGRALSVVLKPVGVEHSDHYGDRGLDTLQIFVPSDAPALEQLRGPGLAWRWLHAGAATGPFLSVLRALRATPVDADRLEWAVLDTLSALTGDLCGRSYRRPPAWLERARQAMDDSTPGSLTVEGVAAEAGVHPVSLTRAFRRCYGVTTSRYLRRVRVRHAARLLAETAGPLSRVAYASGFSDQSHMTRLTRAETGATPAELRRLIHGAATG